MTTYRNTASRKETIIAGAMRGTDMDYASAEVIAEFILSEMPYYNYAKKTLANLPSRLAGFPTEWVMESLVKNGVVVKGE